MATVERYACAYARRGWSVLPLWWPDGDGCACGRTDCSSPTKHPIGRLVPHGLDEATTDRTKVQAWWRDFPAANVGLRTGTISGLVVVDVDGQEGEESMRALMTERGRLSAAWVRTGSGGWHAYLAHPGRPIPNSAGRLGVGVDVRGDGGYVVAPPSLHISGNRYTWQRRGVRLPQMPRWLVDLLAPPAQPARPAPAVRSVAGVSPYAAAAIEREAREVAAAPQGQRNQRLNVAAWRLGQLVSSGHAPASTVAQVLVAAARSAGLGDREIEATIRSGVRAGERLPREVPRA